jgi:catechol 2,3-dioxygenase-like lactoylglutathione lyase family enzyme
MAETFGKSAVTQVGMIVRDIEKSLDSYVEVFKLDKRPRIYEIDGLEVSHMKYLGKPSEARAKQAFIPAGQVTIELIEPIGGPSTWREFLETHGEGVHHIAFEVKGTDQVVSVLAGQGIPVVQQGDYTGGRYTYVSSEDRLGVILELLENFT